MDLTYLFFHSAAEILLLWCVVLGAFLVQRGLVDPIVDGLAPVSILKSAKWLVPPAEQERWNFFSFLIWAGVNMFGSFALHLPSLWTRRVQVRNPTQPLDKKWYESLKKPWWHPSDIFFPMVWIPSKLLKSIVNSLVWEACGRRLYAAPVLISITCVVVADLWNQVFFVQHDFNVSVLIIRLLVFLEVTYAILANQYVPGASKLLYPLLMALSFAAILSTNIAWNNASSKKTATKKVL